jgi:hypothetical protein
VALSRSVHTGIGGAGMRIATAAVACSIGVWPDTSSKDG